jgi:hypothetical protein
MLSFDDTDANWSEKKGSASATKNVMVSFDDADANWGEPSQASSSIPPAGFQYAVDAIDPADGTVAEAAPLGDNTAMVANAMVAFKVGPGRCCPPRHRRRILKPRFSRLWAVSASCQSYHLLLLLLLLLLCLLLLIPSSISSPPPPPPHPHTRLPLPPPPPPALPPPPPPSRPLS